MNKLRAILTLLAALLLASATVFIVVRYVAPRSHNDTHKIAVAERDIELGAPLAPDDLKLVEWPRDSTPAGSFNELGGLLRDSSTQTPRIARSTILKGEPVLESHLAPLGSQGGLSAVIRPGNRAITVRVNDVVGVAGFALPGSYVDVLVNTTVPGAQVGGSEGSISKIVLEHILVLAAAQEVAREDAKPKVVNAVTLEVTPDQAERLDLARSVGTLSLVLRNLIDQGETTSHGIDKETLLQWATRRHADESPPPPTSAPAAPPPPAPARAVAPRHPIKESVEVIRGTDRSQQEL